MTLKTNPKYSPAFAEATRPLAFSLSLSRNMIIGLTQVAVGAQFVDAYRKAGLPCASYTAFQALRVRGLVESYVPDMPGIVRLTEAGRHVYALLQISGHVTELAEMLVQDPMYGYKAVPDPDEEVQSPG